MVITPLGPGIFIFRYATCIEARGGQKNRKPKPETERTETETEQTEIKKTD
jgi:hypothetical protein